MSYTHEVHTSGPGITLEEFGPIWETNKRRFWVNHAFSERLWNNYNITTEEDAKVYIHKRLSKCFSDQHPGLQHVVKRDGDVAAIRIFAGLSASYNFPGSEEITEKLGNEFWWKSTAYIPTALYTKDENGSSEWIEDLRKRPEEKTALASLGYDKWVIIASGQLQKAWLYNHKEMKYVGNYVDDNDTPASFLGPYGWPDDLGQVGT
tara:strand:+ start:1286 stop:1903 length:618 start_codon:yes stop_codon:yes gene_type:complete